jgi:hypothetical protein
VLACVTYVEAQLAATLELSSSGSFLQHRQQVVCKMATHAMQAVSDTILATWRGPISDPCLPLTVVRAARAAVEAAAQLELANAQLRLLHALSFQTVPAPPGAVQPAVVPPMGAGNGNPAAEPAAAEPAAPEPAAVAAAVAGPAQFPNSDSLRRLGCMCIDPAPSEVSAGEAAPAESGGLADAAQPAVAGSEQAAQPEQTAQPEQQAACSAGTGHPAVSNAAVLQAMQSSEEGSGTSGRGTTSGAAGAQLVRALLSELPPDQSAEEGLQAVSQALSRGAALLAVGSMEGVEPTTRQGGASGGWAQRDQIAQGMFSKVDSWGPGLGRT